MQVHLQVGGKVDCTENLIEPGLCFSRYYNRSGNGRLSFDEFCQLVRDIREAKGFSTDGEDVKNEAAVSAK